MEQPTCIGQYVGSKLTVSLWQDHNGYFVKTVDEFQHVKEEHCKLLCDAEKYYEQQIKLAD